MWLGALPPAGTQSKAGPERGLGGGARGDGQRETEG